jgi:hypothetical protein
MSNDVAGSNSLADLAVGIHVEHEEALWSATVRVPQDYTIISITRGIHASNKVRGPSRTKEPLPFGNFFRTCVTSKMSRSRLLDGWGFNLCTGSEWSDPFSRVTTVY